MRNQDQIPKIKTQIEDPRSVEEFLSAEEIDYLINLYEKADDLNNPYVGKIKKNTGPITLDIRPLMEDPVVASMTKHI